MYPPAIKDHFNQIETVTYPRGIYFIKIMSASPGYPVFLIRTEPGGWTVGRMKAPAFHFNKGQFRSVPGNNIYFTLRTAVVSDQHHHTLAFQQVTGGVFTSGAKAQVPRPGFSKWYQHEAFTPEEFPALYQ
jgi:hypothetical protein